MPSQQQTLEQERVAQAWNNVTSALSSARKAIEAAWQEAEQKKDRRQADELCKDRDRLNSPEGGEKFKGAYGALARKTPALIMSAGLGQTLAFLRAKGKGKGWNEHQMLYNHLSVWVVGRLSVNASDLLEVVRQNTSEVYRLATVEALAFLVWLKRFAEAELPEPEGE